MKKQLFAVILVLTLAGFACSVQNIQMKTIDNQIVFINETLPDNSEAAEIVFKMSGGEFLIYPGAQGLVKGSIVYNVEQWEPQFTRSNNYYEIKQVNPFNISGIPTGDVINKWDLALTDAVPLSLSIEGGASKNIFDFSGLQLTALKVIQGASDTTIRFDSPNPLIMDTFNFTTGASSAKIYGLGHANFEQMTMSAGAGDYTLDFSGSLSREAVVDIKAGISNINILIPAGMKAVVNNQGTVSNINTKGTWLVTDTTYTSMEEGITLTINLDLSVGNVNLIHEE